MADVRSLLRSERASRRIVHPHLSYSASGVLICQVCSIQIKSEPLWESHLRSKQHAARLQRGDAGPAARASTTAASDKGKRKLADEESDDGRKRIRSGKNAAPVVRGFLPEGFFDEPTEGGAIPAGAIPGEDGLGRAQLDSIPVRARDPAPPAALSTAPPQESLDTAPRGESDEVDEDEWAAFERDIAVELVPAPPSLSALTATATISAPALTASEVAAQDAAGVQMREKKEAELEAEKEDAARQLEEEFDEMDSLEERVRRLREKREELRQATAKANAIPAAEVDMGDAEREGGAGAGIDGGEGGIDAGIDDDGDDDDDDGGDDDDDDDDWNEWRLRGA